MAAKLTVFLKADVTVTHVSSDFLAQVDVFADTRGVSAKELVCYDGLLAGREGEERNYAIDARFECGLLKSAFNVLLKEVSRANTYSPTSFVDTRKLTQERRKIDVLLLVIRQVLQLTFVVRGNRFVAQVACQNPDSLGAIDHPILPSIFILAYQSCQSILTHQTRSCLLTF